MTNERSPVRVVAPVTDRVDVAVKTDAVTVPPSKKPEPATERR